MKMSDKTTIPKRAFRPWGPLHWLIPKLGTSKWSILGTMATGERCLSVWDYFRSRDDLKGSLFLEIQDAVSPIWGDKPRLKIEQQRRVFESTRSKRDEVTPCDIRDNLDEIRKNGEYFISRCNDNVVIDISSMPKRFCFPLLKYIMKSSTASNIVATYSRPRLYDHRRPLAIDPEPWRALPGYQEPLGDRRKKIEQIIIVGLGYEPLGLPQVLKEFNSGDIWFLFPFPSSAYGCMRNWNVVSLLAEGFTFGADHLLRVDPYDVSSVYDWIVRLSGPDDRRVIFAPYGAKTMSLAMCLYCIAHPEKTGAYYTQPASYNPNYAVGIKMLGDFPESYGYVLRADGRNYYD